MADRRTEEVLLTDFGEFRPIVQPDSLAAVDVDSLEDVPAPAPAPPCEIVDEFPTPVANGGTGVVTGADYEKIPKEPGDTGPPDTLVANGVFSGAVFYDAEEPFSVGRPMGSTAPSDTIEDNSVNRVNPPEEPAGP